MFSNREALRAQIAADAAQTAALLQEEGPTGPLGHPVV